VFDRFTAGARQCVVLAQHEAIRLHHHYVGTEHLLLGLLGDGAGVGGQVLAEMGANADAMRRAIVEMIGLGPEFIDSQALAAIGINLEDVRARVEETFGPGALDLRPLRVRRRRWPRPLRRRSCDRSHGSAYLSFTPRTKKVLELALREALGLRHDHVGTEHILLGLVEEREGVAVQLLIDRGIRPADVRARVLARVGKVA
jgi:ATP-dependent Clp protease ATP-binding subunit ClpA